MFYLYGSKTGQPKKLVATFDSEQQLLAYVRWATLSAKEGVFKFEQGSALAGCQAWSYDEVSEKHGQQADVLHNPSPSML